MSDHQFVPLQDQAFEPANPVTVPEDRQALHVDDVESWEPTYDEYFRLEAKYHAETAVRARLERILKKHGIPYSLED